MSTATSIRTARYSLAGAAPGERIEVGTTTLRRTFELTVSLGHRLSEASQ